MGIFGKVAIAVALMLPLAAYVTGTLVAGEPAPARNDPIVMQVPQTDEEPSLTPSGDATPAPPRDEPSEGPQGGPEDETEQPRVQEPRSKREPEVITVDPDDLGDGGGGGQGDDDGDDGWDDDGDDDTDRSRDDDSDSDDDDGDDDD